MAAPNHVPTAVRFGNFEVSPHSQELSKNGVRLKVSGQAIQVLLILLEVPGRIVAREELQQKLWPGASFGDFDHGLNAAVNRLRDVLSDSATEPKFIETVPRRGYRFIGQTVEVAGPDSEPPIPVAPGPEITGNWLFRSHRLRFSSAVGLLALFVVGSYLALRDTKSPQEMRVAPFTTFPGFEGSPTFSPDGNQIAFTWYPGDRVSTAFGGDLYVKQIGNEQAVQLTHHEAEFLIPAWSPDGRNIAFGMTEKDGSGIYLIPALGGRERRLAELSRDGWQWLVTSWSPDSKWLAFASDSVTEKTAGTAARRYRIHLLDVETGDERVLPEPASDCAGTIEPAISPDGKYLASVCVLTVGLNKLYVQQLDGKRPRELVQVDTSYVLSGLAWSVDGHSILYSTYGSGGRLWRVPVEGGRPEQLPFEHGTSSPAVAHAGHRLAYMQTNYHFDIWSVRLDRITATKAEKFISSTWDQANPQISPDGKLIAFDSNRSGNYEVWVCDRDGSKPLQLSLSEGPQTGSPRWSPDSREIVFNSQVSGHKEIYVVPVNGGRPHRVATGTPNAQWPFWSSDGRSIYFSTDAPNGVWKVPAEGGVAVRLTRDGTFPQESTDGKRVFYVAGTEQDQLWSVSVNGGDEHREEGMPKFVNDLSWTPAESGIFLVDGPPSHLSIKYFSFSDRRTEDISQLRGISFVCCSIKVSRDNGTLLFSAVDRLESDIMLVENFH
jgi:Tol biopolymer transport system component/DNA-binding winged helix-turn-helix (wHTH) protein